MEKNNKIFKNIVNRFNKLDKPISEASSLIKSLTYTTPASSTLKTTYDSVTSELSKLSTNTKNYIDSTSMELFIIFFLILYAGFAAHKLPDNVLSLLNNNYVKFVYLVLWLVVVSKKNWTIAIIMIIIFLVTMKLLSVKKIDNKLNDLVNFMLYKNYIDDNKNDKNVVNNNVNESSLNNSMLYSNEVDNVYAKF
jgi:hypothetical protein